jgi:hypothetical protein
MVFEKEPRLPCDLLLGSLPDKEHQWRTSWIGSMTSIITPVNI